MKKIILVAFAVTVFATTAPASAQVFSNDFEGDLSGWVGKSGGVHHGQIVTDPLDGSNSVLNFTLRNSAGDIFSSALSVTPGQTYTLSFDYLGHPDTGDDLGGFIGYSHGTPGEHYWLAGTQATYPGIQVHLIDDGTWHRYNIDFVPSVSSIRIMLEDFMGSDYITMNAYFDNITLNLAGVEVEVEIDIKPGSYPNSINPNAGGVIPVAILTSDTFDASTVNPETVALEGASARGKGKSGKYGSIEDVDGDGDLDLVVQVVNEIDWAPDATEATLTGFTWGGIPIEGTDSVNIVPPEQQQG